MENFEEFKARIEFVAELMAKKKLDWVKVGDVELKKSQHDVESQAPSFVQPMSQEDISMELRALAGF